MLITSQTLREWSSRRAMTTIEQNARSLQQHQINLVAAQEACDAQGVQIARQGIQRCQHVANYFAHRCA